MKIFDDLVVDCFLICFDKFVSAGRDGLMLRLAGAPELDIWIVSSADLRRLCQEGNLPTGAVARPAAILDGNRTESIKLVEESVKALEGSFKSFKVSFLI